MSRLSSVSSRRRPRPTSSRRRAPRLMVDDDLGRAPLMWIPVRLLHRASLTSSANRPSSDGLPGASTAGEALVEAFGSPALPLVCGGLVLTRATARQMPILPPVSGQIDGERRVLRCRQTGAKWTGLKTPSRGPLRHSSHSSMCSRHARRPWRRGWRVRRPGRGTERESSFLTKMSARMAADGVLPHNRMIQITACYTSVCVCAG
jgi:hypothetical protein